METEGRKGGTFRFNRTEKKSIKNYSFRSKHPTKERGMGLKKGGIKRAVFWTEEGGGVFFGGGGNSPGRLRLKRTKRVRPTRQEEVAELWGSPLPGKGTLNHFPACPGGAKPQRVGRCKGPGRRAEGRGGVLRARGRMCSDMSASEFPESWKGLKEDRRGAKRIQGRCPTRVSRFRAGHLSKKAKKKNPKKKGKKESLPGESGKKNAACEILPIGRGKGRGVRR